MLQRSFPRLTLPALPLWNRRRYTHDMSVWNYKLLSLHILYLNHTGGGLSQTHVWGHTVHHRSPENTQAEKMNDAEREWRSWLVTRSCHHIRTLSVSAPSSCWFRTLSLSDLLLPLRRQPHGLIGVHVLGKLSDSLAVVYDCVSLSRVNLLLCVVSFWGEDCRIFLSRFQFSNFKNQYKSPLPKKRPRPPQMHISAMSFPPYLHRFEAAAATGMTALVGIPVHQAGRFEC